MEGRSGRGGLSQERRRYPRPPARWTPPPRPAVPEPRWGRQDRRSIRRSPPRPARPSTRPRPRPALGGQWGQLATEPERRRCSACPTTTAKDQQPDIKPSPMIGPRPQARNVSPLLGQDRPGASTCYAQRMAAPQSADDMGRGPARADAGNRLWPAGPAVRLRNVAHVEPGAKLRPDVDELVGCMNHGCSNPIRSAKPGRPVLAGPMAEPVQQFNNAALPWPSSYAGMPTDAMGKPIQPPPGMTLNSSPQAQQPAAPAAAEQTACSQADLQVPMRRINPSGNQAFGDGELGRGCMSATRRSSPMPDQQCTRGRGSARHDLRQWRRRTAGAAASRRQRPAAAPNSLTYPQVWRCSPIPAR